MKTIGSPQTRGDNPVFTQIAATAVSVIGCAALLGWWLNYQPLKGLIPGVEPIKPNIAVEMLFCGASLLLLSLTRFENLLRWAAALAAGAAALVAATLVEIVCGWNLGVDDLFTPGYPALVEQSNPGWRMQPATAFSYLTIGLALFLAARRPTPARVALIAGLSASQLIPAVLGLTAFFLVGNHWNPLGMTSSGVTTAITFLLLGGGLLVLLRRKGVLAWSLDKLTTLGFAIGILVMVITTATAFTYAKRMLETATWTNHR